MLFRRIRKISINLNLYISSDSSDKMQCYTARPATSTYREEGSENIGISNALIFYKNKKKNSLLFDFILF